MNVPPDVHDLEDPVHVRGVDPVEVDRVRMRSGVRELHAQELALGGADDGARHRAVVGPGGEGDALGHLDVAVGGDELVLGHVSGHRRRRVEQLVEVVRSAGRRDLGSDHRRVPHCRVVVALVRGERLGALGALGQRQLHERHGGQRRRRGDQELASCDWRFRHV